MRTTLFLSLVVILLSCRKNDTPGTPGISDPKLKRISYSNDTIYPLCIGCPPTVSYLAESFSYDGRRRLTIRTLTKTRLSPAPVRTDTTATYVYYYAANSYDNKIVGYTDIHSGSSAANHVLTYDSQNRLIKDSIMNPQMSNNKLTVFSYLPGFIIQYEKQTFPAGPLLTYDTLFISGNDVVQEKLLTATTHRELTHTASAYRNPLSYVNNFSLLASDYKNAGNTTSFSIFFMQNVTYHFPTQTLVKTWSNSSPVSQYTSTFQIGADSLNRIINYRNSSNGNKVTTFEYY